MFPHRGWYNTLSAEFAEPAFLSQSQFQSLHQGALCYFYPLGPLTLRLQTEAGLITSLDASRSSSATSWAASMIFALFLLFIGVTILVSIFAERR